MNINTSIPEIRCPTIAKGNYLLVYWNKFKTRAFVPRFGDLNLLPGYYFYCGSAHGNGGLRARIIRHQAPPVKKYWHIDFIKDNLTLIDIWFQQCLHKNECSFSQFLINRMDGSSIIKGFGSSDCRNGCESHFIFLSDEVDLDEIFNGFASEFDKMARIHPFR